MCIGRGAKTGRTIAIIQARMGSSRLPGKVLERVGCDPIVAHVVRRAASCPLLDGVVVATTTLSEDDVLARCAENMGAKVFRGSVLDVLDRYHGAAEMSDARVVVRLTSDNPFVDPDVLCGLIKLREHGGYSYARTSGFPIGVGAEAFTRETLEEAWGNTRKDFEREHVTPYMYRDGRVFGVLRSPEDLSGIRLTVDERADLDLARTIYDALAPRGGEPLMEEILSYLDTHPEAIEINSVVHQKELGE